MNILIIFAKYPEPGKVKTRLGADIGFNTACELCKIFLELTFNVARKTNFDSIQVYFTPEHREEEWKKLTPNEFGMVPQKGNSLGAKLHNAFYNSFKLGASKTVIIGSDSPTLPASYISQAIDLLDENELVLGPADDGGYYLIAAKDTHQFLLEDIEWSTPAVLSQTLQKARSNNLKCTLLPEWYDVDDLKSLQKAIRDDPSKLIAGRLEKNPNFSFLL